MYNKILIVDDDSDSLNMQQAIVQRLGFYSQVAINGIDAIRIIKENAPDLILLDIFMPQMDGYETAKLIKEKYKIPIIIITAGGNQAINKIKEMGLPYFIQKPITPSKLQREVMKCLKQIQEN